MEGNTAVASAINVNRMAPVDRHQLVADREEPLEAFLLCHIQISFDLFARVLGLAGLDFDEERPGAFPAYRSDYTIDADLPPVG